MEYQNENGKAFQHVSFAREALKKKDDAVYKANLAIVKQINGKLNDITIECELFFLEADYYYHQLDIGKTLDIMFKGIEFTRKHGLTIKRADMLNYIGVCFSALGLFEKSKKYFRESLELNDSFIVSCNLADRFLEGAEYEKGIQLLNDLIRKAREEGNDFKLGQTYVSLGDFYLARNELEIAYEYFVKGLEHCVLANDVRKEDFAYIGLGKYYLLKNDLEQAKMSLEKAVSIATEAKHPELEWFSFMAIKELYEKTEDYDNLCVYLKKIDALKDKIFLSSIEQKINSLETAYALENKKLEAEKMIEKSSRLVSIGVMAAGITHEINQPLNTIAVNADGMLFTNEKENVLPPFYIDAIQQILDASGRISEIINHMRQFWSPDDYLEKLPFDANAAIVNALRLLNKKLDAHGVELRRHFSEKNAIIRGNSVHLEQIVINLIVNALHAFDKKKNTVSHKIIDISTEVAETLIISITDNATGFGKKSISELFDPFYTTHTSAENMGLGLAIVKQLVESMNGEITGYNNEIGGATFTIKLPVRNENEDIIS